MNFCEQNFAVREPSDLVRESADPYKLHRPVGTPANFTVPGWVILRMGEWESTMAQRGVE